MDDLISRKTLLNDLCTDREEGTFCFTDSQAEAADKIIMYVAKRIEVQPTVDAVPLDKLCEWLERYATMDCDGCRASIGSCEDEENHEVSVCNSWERWKAMLTKWMEGLDAVDRR